jgi:transposase
VETLPKTARAALPAKLKKRIGGLITQQESLTRQIKAYDKKIEKLADSKKYGHSVQKLTKIQGVGKLTALAFILTIGDPKAFEKSRDIGPYLGLVPKHDKSGKSDKPLSITKAGDSGMRRLLVLSANYIMGPFGEDCDLCRHGERVAGSGSKVGRRKAKVAVARKLSVLMHRLLLSEAEYQPLFNSRRKSA